MDLYLTVAAIFLCIRGFYCAEETPCKEGWTRFESKCFKYFGNGLHRSFSEANKVCKSFGNGAELASIHSEEEQDFLTILIGTNPMSSWIGLRQNLPETSFTWTDGSEVGYLKWAKGEPSSLVSSYFIQNNIKEPCVYMYGALNIAGQWNDGPCPAKLAFICQSNTGNYSSERNQSDCEVNGYVRYRTSCYKLDTSQQADFYAAESVCQFEGGHLLSINDVYENIFVNTVLLKFIANPVWIGLTDSNSGKSILFLWTDNFPVYFTAWANDEPSRKNSRNRCATRMINNRWKIEACSTPMAFVCEINDEKPPQIESDLNGVCPESSSAWFDLGTSKCYLVNYYMTLTWNGALDACRQIDPKASMISFHSIHEIKLLHSYVAESNTNLWIGLNRRPTYQNRNNPKFGWKWQDGSAFGFSNWNDDEPSSHKDELCVELQDHSMKWNNVECSRKLGFICTIPKVVYENSYTQSPADLEVSSATTTKMLETTRSTRQTFAVTTRAVTTTNPVTTTNSVTTTNPVTLQKQFANCGPGYEDWLKNGGSCYYVQTKGFPFGADWYTAETFCRNNGAHLVCPKTIVELIFVINLVKNNDLTHDQMWIGFHAIRNGLNFEWSDGTAVSAKLPLTNVDPDKRCYFIDKTTGKTNVSHCSSYFGFICKRSVDDVASTITTPTTTLSPLYCYVGWTRYGNQCFKLFQDKLKRDDARSECKKYSRGDLVAINTFEKHTLLMSLLQNQNETIWIGLTKISYHSYGWLDNSVFEFSNWFHQSTFFNQHEGQCNVMNVGKTIFGTWRSAACTDENKYICQTIPVLAQAINVNSKCKDGFKEYGDACYKIVVDKTLTWYEAEKECQKQGGHLASFGGYHEMAFVKLNLFPFEDTSFGFWIGLWSRKKSRIFQWVDKWPVYYTDWADNQPIYTALTMCAYIDSETFKWETAADCTGRKAGYVCKINLDSAPEIPNSEINYQSCPPQTSDWYNFGTDDCYFFSYVSESASTRPWSIARSECAKKGGDLASLHSIHEVSLLGAWIPEHTTGSWIGLFQNIRGSVEWSDGTPYDLNLVDDSPNIFSQLETSQHCIILLQSSFTYKFAPCNAPINYICKIKKLPTSQIDGKGSEATTVTTSKYNSSPKYVFTNQTNFASQKLHTISDKATTPGGMIAVVSTVIVLCALVAIAAIIVWRKRNYLRQSNPNVQNPTYQELLTEA